MSHIVLRDLTKPDIGSPMHSLDVIKSACIEAIDTQEDDPHWRGLYCSIVGPATVLEMAQQIETFEKVVTMDELQALGKLVRDMSGYIKMTGGDKPDPVRDDLLLQAKQLLDVAGI